MAAFASGLSAAGVRLTAVFDPPHNTAPGSSRKSAEWTSRDMRRTASVGALHALVSGAPVAPTALLSTPPPLLFLNQVKAQPAGFRV